MGFGKKIGYALEKVNQDSAGLSQYLTEPTAGRLITRWEYAVIHIDGGSPLEFVRTQLNDMGRFGWQLVERRDKGIGWTRGENSFALFFKRPL